MTGKITLTPYMRDLLLDEVCRRMDIIDYCNCSLHITLELNIKDIFIGECPFCNDRDSFAINKATGKYCCVNCDTEGDFFTLMSKKDGRDLDSTLQVLSGCLEKAERSRQPYAGGGI
jgi:phage/plasmid primase-like uncharacterized protein